MTEDVMLLDMNVSLWVVFVLILAHASVAATNCEVVS